MKASDARNLTDTAFSSGKITYLKNKYKFPESEEDLLARVKRDRPKRQGGLLFSIGRLLGFNKYRRHGRGW